MQQKRCTRKSSHNLRIGSESCAYLWNMPLIYPFLDRAMGMPCVVNCFNVNPYTTPRETRTLMVVHENNFSST